MVMTLDAVKAEVEAWYKPILGTFPNPDNKYGAQCKDLITVYIRDVHSEPYVVGNGIDMARNLISQQGWRSISATGKWQIGDVVSTTGASSAGHVYVVLEDLGDRVKMVDLNGGPQPANSGPDEAVKVRTQYKRGVVNVARPPRYVGATASTSTPAPTPVVQSPETILSKHLSNASVIVAAAKATGVPIHIAAAVAWRETVGKHIYGHDAGGIYSTNGRSVTIGSTTYPVNSNIPVTAANFAGFRSQLLTADGSWTGRTSNGVGIMQVTFWGFIRDALNKGYDLSDPRQNVEYALKYILAPALGGDYSEASVKMAATSYNAGPGLTTPNAYGIAVWEKAEEYRVALGVPASSPTNPPAEPTPEPEPTPVEPPVPPDPTPEMTTDPGPLPELPDPPTAEVKRDLPNPVPGPIVQPAALQHPLARVWWRGQWWSPLEVKLDRDLSIPGPDQSPLGAPLTEATGQVLLGKPAPISARGWNAWRDNPPTPFEPVIVQGSDDDGITWHTLFTGRVDDSGGAADDASVLIGLVDHTDALRRRISMMPKNFRMPSPHEGRRYMCIGLHPVYVADLVARSSGYYATPPRHPDAFISAPMMGSAWPERGTLFACTAIEPKDATSGIPGDSPEYQRTPWGLAVTNLFARYSPNLDGDDSRGMLTGLRGLRAMVGPAGERYSFIELWWDRACLAFHLQPDAIELRVETGWDARGERIVAYTRRRSITAEQTRDGYELRVWMDEDGGLQIGADDHITTHTPFPQWPAEMRAMALSELRVTTRLASAAVGGVSLAPLKRAEDMGEWHQTFLADVDPDVMLWGTPGVVNRDGLELLREMAAAELSSMWIDEDGMLRYVSRTRMDVRPSVRTITEAVLSSAPWSIGRSSLASSVTVARRQPSLYQNRRHSSFGVQVWEGPRDELEPDSAPQEVIVEVPDDEDWIYVDGSFSDVSESTIAEANKRIGSWMGGTVLREGEDGRVVELPAPRSWFWGSAERIDWQTFKAHFGYTPPPATTALMELSVPDLVDKGLRRSLVGAGPILRARGLQKWADIDFGAPVHTGAVVDAPIEYVHDARWWVQSELAAKRIAHRLAKMLAKPIPAWGPVEMAQPDLSIRLGDTVTLSLGGRSRPQRVCGVRLSFTPGEGLTQSLTLRQIRP